MLLLVTISSCNVTPAADGQATSVPHPDVVDAAPARLPRDVEQRVYDALAADFGVSETDVDWQQVSAVDWTDACLGVAQPDEFCAQVITPGYRVVVGLPNGQYVLHSDRSGHSLRIAQTP